MTMYEIIRVEEIDSTNTLAKEYAQRGALAGTAVIAENQTAGRGRLGKTWQSIAGKGLYCSIVLRPQIERNNFAKITLVAGLAVAEALENISQLPVLLKWPNDVYINGKKCAGILCEASMGSGALDDFVVVGIGVNITLNSMDFRNSLNGLGTSLLIETGKSFSKAEVFEKIHISLLKHIGEVEKIGISEILKRWRIRDLLAGKIARWVSVAGNVIEGEALGIDDEGVLYVRDQRGILHEILSGDVQLAQSS